MDDTELWLSFKSTAADAVHCLEGCLAAVLDWMRRNRLKLNLTRWRSCCRGDPLIFLGDISLRVNRFTLPYKDQKCDLGFILNPVLTMKKHVFAVTCADFFQLWRIAQLRPDMDIRSIAILVHTLVVPKLTTVMHSMWGFL